MEVKPTIKLLFFSLLKDEIQIVSYKLSFDNTLYKVNSEDKLFNIPVELFKYGKDKAKIFIELFNSSTKLLNTIECPVNYCENNIYIQLDGTGKGMNFDIVFKNFKDLNISISGKEFNSLDSAGTKDRKKLTILNYNLCSIYVNKTEINLIQNIGKKSSEFLQYSINLKDYKVIVQSKKELEPEQPELHLLMKNKKIYDEFYKEIKELFQKGLNNNNLYYRILNHYKNNKELKFIEFNLNLPQ